MGDNSTQNTSNQVSLTSTKTVVYKDTKSLSASSDVSSSDLTAAHSVDQNLFTNSELHTSLTSSHESVLTVHHSINRHPETSQHSSKTESSRHPTTTTQPSSTSATPPLTSSIKPYKTSNLKISSQPSEDIGLPSVQLTSHISPSSVFVPSSSIPPILPTSKPTTTNGSISSTTTPSALTDNLTLILGISLCGVGLVVLLIIVLCICCRKKSKTKQQTVETVQIGDLWASNRGDISYAPTFDSVLDTVSESPQVKEKSKKDILYHVLYPYTAQDDSQLSLDLGDVVTLIEKRGNGWWKGKIKDKEGWFPGSYVEEAEIGTGYTSNHHLHNGSLGVSSFMKNQDLTPKLAKNSSNRNSAPVFSYDKKVLGKEVSIPKVPTPTTSPLRSPSESKPNSPAIICTNNKTVLKNVDGIRYHVLYKHDPSFSNELKIEPGDIIIGIEKDINGWMKGKKEKSGESGMFPAIYVQEIIEEEVPGGYKDRHSVYNQLPVYCNDTSTAAYIGIEHVAVCPYAAENETDLSFDIGDTIVVCQTLDNGWWYGCDGEQFGWFPGSYVEMIEDEVDGPVTRETTYEGEITHDNIPDNTVICDKPLEASIDKDIAALSPIKPHGGNKSEDEISQKSVDSVDKKVKISNNIAKDSPKRSKLPTAVRPSRPAPPPPPGHHHSTPESKTNLMDKFNKTKENNAIKINSQIKKPEIPKRFIKPKLRKVPKQKTKAGNESELCRRKVRSPPPPRPDPPKLLAGRTPLNQNKKQEQDVINESNMTQNTPHSEIYDSITENDVSVNNEINQNQNVLNEGDSQNMTSFLENSVTTDSSFGKMSGMTSLSMSVQGDRTHDQSELTSVSAINMSDMNDSKHISNKINLSENNPCLDASDAKENISELNHSGLQDTNTDKENLPSESIDNSYNQPTQSNEKQKPESRIPCKLPQLKSNSVRGDSPKPSLVPKSQSLRGGSPKPPPVAPKPSKLLYNRNISPCREPLYSEVGTSLVGNDVSETSPVGTDETDADDSNKIELYKRPQSPIYSKIDKKRIVPNLHQPKESDLNLNDYILTSDYKPSSIEAENNPDVPSRISSDVENNSDVPSKVSSEAANTNNDLEPENIVTDKIDSHPETPSEQDVGVVNPITDTVQDHQNVGSNSLQNHGNENSHSVQNQKKDSQKASSIPGPAHVHSSSIPKKIASPSVKSSIPKPPNSSPAVTRNESINESDRDTKVKPERPSRPPNVVRHSSLSSPSPSRLPKVEKSRSLRSESPKTVPKHQRLKTATKDGSKIPSGIPMSPKQKSVNKSGSSRTGSSPSRLPRKAVNGVVSPKPQRPPPPKSPPTSPLTDSPSTRVPKSPPTSPMIDSPSTYIESNGDHLPKDGKLHFNNGDISPNPGNIVLKKTMASYSPRTDEELAFDEGCFIREISRDEETGLCVGMLPDGTTGLYHSKFVEDSINEQQSIV